MRRREYSRCDSGGSRLALVYEYVDEIVGRVNRHAQLLAHGDERLVVQEHAMVIDALGGEESHVEVVPVGERAPDVSADQKPGGGRRWTEERVLHANQLE